MKLNKDEIFQKTLHELTLKTSAGYNLLTLWKNCVRANLKKDWTVTDDEIKSEIVEKLRYLAGKWDESRCADFLTYVNRYIVPLSTRIFAETYNKMKMNSRFINEYSNDFSDFYVYRNGLYDHVGNNVGYWPDDVDEYAKLEERLDRSNKRQIEIVYEAAMKLDEESNDAFGYAFLIDDLRAGMTEEEIAEAEGVTKQAISARLSKIKERAKELVKALG